MLVPCGGRRTSLPVLHHNADNIFISFGMNGLIVDIWKWSSAHVCARGRKQRWKFHYCLWRVSIKPGLPFSIRNMFFVSKSNLVSFIYLLFYLFEVVFVKCVCIWRTSVFFQFYGVLSGVIYNYSTTTFFLLFKVTLLQQRTVLLVT